VYIDVASPPSLAPYLDIFVIQHSFKIRVRVICSSRHIISRSPVICRLWYPSRAKSCSGWVARSLLPTLAQAPSCSCFSSFYSLLSTKRPPMLWGSTCRAVTSFRPYELNRQRQRSLRMYASIAYIYQLSTDRSTERRRRIERVERVYLSTTDQPIDLSTDRPTDRPYVYGRLHRTATRIVLFD